MKTITVLGSTGSIGKQTLDVARRNEYRVLGLTANSSVDIICSQAREFKPEKVAVADEKSYHALKNELFGTGIEVLCGDDGVCNVAAVTDADTVINAIVGIAGLRPTLAAIKNGVRLALANKESLVTAGSLVMSAVKNKGAELIPVDSEHSAIFQSLRGSNRGELKKIILTASGGPFFGMKKNELENITPEKALRHPNWTMGRKITIDSATLMNKGLEVIEAVHLFGVSADDIEVLVHRQSILHSAVEFCDGAVIGQLGVPDMKLPIQYALTYPERQYSPDAPLDLVTVGKLTFEKPDTETFKCLPVCINAIKLGGLKPAAANGANEAAVRLFLEGKIGFLQIGELVEAATDAQPAVSDFTVDDVFDADTAARKYVYESILK